MNKLTLQPDRDERRLTAAEFQHLAAVLGNCTDLTNYLRFGFKPPGAAALKRCRSERPLERRR